MTDLNIKIDMDRVQSSVNAAIRPAVDAALKSVDLQKIVETMLLDKPKKPQRDDVYSLFLYSGPGPTGPLIETLVQKGISEIAKQYIERELAAQEPMLEEAFCQMMRGSQSTLVKAFAQACTKALKDSWTFEMATTVSHKEPESERSYDD